MSARRPRKGRRPRFSVVTIVRNEESRLPRLLASLREFRERGGEVVVLDTGSRDRTVQVAADAGCRVFVEPRRFRGTVTARQAARIHATFMKGGEGPLVQAGDPLFHFGHARAHAGSLARHNLQLAVDGGDVVEAMDIDTLDAAARSADQGAFHFETRTLSPTGWHIEVREYLSDRRKAGWHGRSHQYLKPNAGQGKLEPRRLSRDQLFVSHHTDLGKPRAYQLAGMALDTLGEPDSVRYVFYLSRAMTALGFHRSALDLALSLDRADVAGAVRSAALCFAARCAHGLGQGPDEVETHLFRAALRDPTRRDPFLRLAALARDRGDMQAAASFATAALEIPAKVGISEPEENLGARPHAILYWSLLWLGRIDEARTHFDRCLKLDPANSVYQTHASLFSGGSLPR